MSSSEKLHCWACMHSSKIQVNHNIGTKEALAQQIAHVRDLKPLEHACENGPCVVLDGNALQEATWKTETAAGATPFARGLIIDGKVTLVEGATFCILTSQANGIVALIQTMFSFFLCSRRSSVLLQQQCAKSQLLCCRPVHPAVWRVKHLPAHAREHYRKQDIATQG